MARVFVLQRRERLGRSWSRWEWTLQCAKCVMSLPFQSHLLRRYDWTLLAPTPNTFSEGTTGGLGCLIWKELSTCSSCAFPLKKKMALPLCLHLTIWQSFHRVQLPVAFRLKAISFRFIQQFLFFQNPSSSLPVSEHCLGLNHTLQVSSTSFGSWSYPEPYSVSFSGSGDWTWVWVRTYP